MTLTTMPDFADPEGYDFNGDGANGLWWRFWPFEITSDGLGDTNRRRDPFRPAICDLHTDGRSIAATWQPRDSMAWWSDGTSNQFLMAEKHIPVAALNICEGAEGSKTLQDLGQANSLGYSWDCGMGTANGSVRLGFHHVARAAVTRQGSSPYDVIARSPNLGDQEHALRAGFGSWHPGICHFLIGDGSVRAVSVTTRPTLIARLTDTQDGHPVMLP